MTRFWTHEQVTLSALPLSKEALKGAFLEELEGSKKDGPKGSGCGETFWGVVETFGKFRFRKWLNGLIQPPQFCFFRWDSC